MSFFSNYLETMSRHILLADTESLDRSVSIIERVSASGNKVIIAGNGGSAAIASHIAVDLTKSSGIRAVSFNEAQLITCLANDFGYEHWVEKSLQFYANAGDAAVLISSSGRSPNILNGVAEARRLGLTVITLSGFDDRNPLRRMGDENLWVDSGVYNVVEMTHQAWLMAIVDRLSNKRDERLQDRAFASYQVARGVGELRTMPGEGVVPAY